MLRRLDLFRIKKNRGKNMLHLTSALKYLVVAPSEGIFFIAIVTARKLA